jgi:tRNA-uridine 2-sulfurtransferase
MNNTTAKHKIVVGLSGGVDSAVSALLLKEQGHDVMGVFMQNWETDEKDPHCSAEQDLSDARAICDLLDIPFQLVDFSKEYWDNVFQYCLDEFNAGRTPNPDIWCNKEIKFKVFLEHALKLGADYLATGHYVSKQFNGEKYHMHKASDLNKDQSYFLYTLGQHELKHALFPLSDLTKPQVRKIAEENGFINFDKKDSTGICFIGERKFKDFLSEFLLAKPGPMVTDKGKHIGQHDGLMFYTFGQRKGLNIGGRRDASEEAWYVLDKNIANNTLIIGQGHDHPLLFKSELICTQLHWVIAEPKSPLKCSAKTRYRQSDQACEIIKLENDRWQVKFIEPQRAITPGQSIVFYLDSECLGGGIIN